MGFGVWEGKGAARGPFLRTRVLVFWRLAPVFGVELFDLGFWVGWVLAEFSELHEEVWGEMWVDTFELGSWL